MPAQYGRWRIFCHSFQDDRTRRVLKNTIGILNTSNIKVLGRVSGPALRVTCCGLRVQVYVFRCWKTINRRTALPHSAGFHIIINILRCSNGARKIFVKLIGFRWWDFVKCYIWKLLAMFHSFSSSLSLIFSTNILKFI